jgi:GNAT superfamily N-acetyltransferase
MTLAPHPLTHRLATSSDLPNLRLLMARAIDTLQIGFLNPAQIVASRAIMGLDTQLVDDRTYFIVEAKGALAGCGGWSRRATLYGGDHSEGRDAALLNTHPDFARRGVGRLILSLCERAALEEGFARVELAATMAGVPLYRACGYAPIKAFEDDRGGVAVPLVRMGKTIA